MLRSSKCWSLWKEPVVICGNLNVRQPTSQQVFKVTTLCADTCFQSFSSMINYIVHHALLKFSPCRNKTLPQLVHIADWYSMHALLQNAPDAVIYRDEVRIVGWPHVRTDEWTGVSHGAERSSTVSRARCAGALSCWKTNTFPAMLPIAGSSFCVSNTSR